MKFPIKKIGKQGTWPKAIFIFLLPLVLFFIFRWVVFEPFVIPSESMVPNLLVHDHIFVKKYSYGIKMPFGDGWLSRFKSPSRGDVIVFRYPENRDVFFIKRLIGLPGDEVKIINGQVKVNGQAWGIRPLPKEIFDDEEDYSYFAENIPKEQRNNGKEFEFMVRFFSTTFQDSSAEEITYKVPSDSFFVVGDNRDQSHDSRSWGFVPLKLLVGQASFIWLSCEETLESAPMICDPQKLRKDRIFMPIGGI